MSGEERLMRAAVDAFNARDLEAFLSVMSADVEARTLLAELSGEPYRGHGGVSRWWDETLEAWDYDHVELTEVVPGSDGLVAYLAVTGEGRASGVALEMELGMVFRIEDDRCTYFRMHVDRADALKEAGAA